MSTTGDVLLDMGLSVDNNGKGGQEDIELMNIRKSLDCFMEPIDYSLDSCVPDPVPFVSKLQMTLTAHDEFIVSKEQKDIADEILRVVGEYERLNGAKNMNRQLESEQEREQEQEQQREVQAKRDQQIEVEKFVEREYSRADESPHPWSFSLLGEKFTDDADENVGKSKRERDLAEDHPFQKLKQFRLRHQEPLDFPDYMLTSRNYFNPKWQGLRRVKNVVMVMEWAPSTSSIRALSPEEHKKSAEKIHKGASKVALEKAYRLLAARTGAMTREDAFNAIRAATDQKVTDAELDFIMSKFGDANGNISLEAFADLLTSGQLHGTDVGRYFVAVSLAEAATIRRIIHTRSDKPLINNKDAAIALRYTPFATFGGASGNTQPTGDGTETEEEVKQKQLLLQQNRAIMEGGIVFDASNLWREGTQAKTGVPHYQLAEAFNSMRFLDCSMHFSEPALNVLVRALQKNSVHARERFFYTTIGSKRRLERKWQDTPLAKVFTVPDEWFALKQRAQAVFMREAIRSKKLTLWEAFMAFDSDDNGVLSPAEFYGAVRWLGIPDLTEHDVVDMIEAADRNRDGFIDYKEYMFMLRDPDSAHGGDQDEDAHHGQGTDASHPGETNGEEKGSKEEKSQQTLRHVVEPYGADILREVMIQRKRDELARQREDRLRQMLFQQTLDIRVFEEELRASKKRKGGPNPKLIEDKSLKTSAENPVKAVVFSFTTNQKPLRMVSHGNCKFVALNSDTLMAAAAHGRISMPCEKGHELGRAMRYGYSCALCKSPGTNYYCLKGCNFNVCSRCHERFVEEKKRSMADLSDKHTYLECANGSSFSLQIPAFLSTSIPNKINQDASESQLTSESPSSEKEEISVPLKVECSQYTITMEIRVERLPPRGQLAALVRFAPSGAGKSRQKNQASVYIDENGTIGNSKSIPFPIATNTLAITASGDDEESGAKQKKSSSKHQEDQSLSCPGLHQMKWFSTTGDTTCDKCEKSIKQTGKTMLGCRICDYDICLDCCESHFKKLEENKDSQKIGWKIVSLVVDADKGVLTSYVNGKINCIVDSLAREDLLLQHQMVVFGGSKQGHLRGGSIRKLLIHNQCLKEEDIQDLYQKLSIDREIVVVWCNLNNNPLHEPIQKHFIHDASVKLYIVNTEADALKLIKEEGERIQCFVVTLCGTKLHEEELDPSLSVSASTSEPKDQEKEGLTPAQKQALLTPGYQLALEIRDHLGKVPIIMDSTMPPAKKRVLIVGERVQALFKSGKRWYHGQITKVHEGGENEDLYDILYVDGDVELNVPMKNIKPEHSLKSVPISLVQDQLDMVEKLKIEVVPTLEKLEDSLSLACLLSSHRHSVTIQQEDSQ